MLHFALRYLNMGLSVIPLSPKSKVPLIEWKEFQGRKATEAEAREWFVKCPDANLGIVTGAISGIGVIDLDGPEGIKAAAQRGFMSNVAAFSGTGKHLYYQWAENLRNSASKIAEKVDIRGEGGLIAAPPSLHPNGKRYRWINPLVRISSLPLFPKIADVKVAETKGLISNADTTWITEALQEMRHGHIHNTLISVLGKFRAHNFSEGDTYELLKPHCLENGKPFDGLRDKITEFWNRYEAGYGGGTSYTLGEIRPDSALRIKSPGNENDFNEFSSIPETGTNRLRTGFAKLDGFLESGLKSERLFTVAARTGTGKTNFAIALARNLCEQGKKVLFFSTEFSYKKVWQRYIATLGIPDEFRRHAFHVCDSFSPNIAQVEEAIKQVNPDVYIFDHVNHLGEEKELLSQFMSGCNLIQRKHNCQGIMIAQLNRQADWVENGKRVEPRMSMIKSSGSIEQMSSRVLLLSEVKVTPECNEIVGVLDKNDSGDRGIIQFGLFKNPYRFEEI